MTGGGRSSPIRTTALGKIERGSDTVQWGKLFQVLEGLGVRVIVDVPESVAAYLNDPANHKRGRGRKRQDPPCIS